MIRKLRLVSNSVASRTDKKIITIHVLANISEGKGNQVIKFGWLIEHNTRHIFHQRSCRKGRDTSFRPLSVKTTLHEVKATG